MVGVRELKNQLSKYLQLVKQGETVVITEHEQVIAEIKKPSENMEDREKRVYSYLEEQSRIGKLVLAKRDRSQIDNIIKDRSARNQIPDWKEIHEDSRKDRT
ncbi:type II toxin-antitoxin system Phd/YefM family antitoxin [Leptospira langatensis]|nr:toxin-antitoxin system, antitoxin component [Leptospira langatensis]